MKNIIIVAVVLVVVGCNVQPRPKTPKTDQQPQAVAQKPPTIEAVDLLREYGENNVRADQNYKRKVIRVHGQVTGFLGNGVLVEASPAITCWLTNKNDIAKLDKGQSYTFEGTVSLGNEGGVWLKNAKIIGQ